MVGYKGIQLEFLAYFCTKVRARVRVRVRVRARVRVRVRVQVKVYGMKTGNEAKQNLERSPGLSPYAMSSNSVLGMLSTHSLSDSVSAHLWLEVIGRDLGGGNHQPVLSVEWLLLTTVEEESDVGILLCLWRGEESRGWSGRRISAHVKIESPQVVLQQ